MILGIVAYNYVQHTAPEGPVQDFLNSDFLKSYCEGNLYPLLINPISAEGLEDIIDDVEGLIEQEVPMEQLRAAIEWLKTLPQDENTIIAVMEG